MKIAITYICTGSYDIFWDEFYESCEKFFYPGDEKEYFVFTDAKRMFELKNPKIHVIYQQKAGWPYDTLLRFNLFCMIQDSLLQYNLCYFFNANSKLLRPFTKEVIPYPTKHLPITTSLHILNYDDTLGETFHPERNPSSKAYVPQGTYCRAYSGGFFGGTSEAFVEMSRTLRDNIADDLRKGIIAIWHDQSHLIRYAIDHPNYIVAKGLIASEEFADMNCAILIYRNKANYGGNNKLRNITRKERVGKFLSRVKKKLFKK